MALNDYTSYPEVRGVLGVTDNELDDDTLALDVYSFNLNSDLRDIHPLLPSAFKTASDKPEASRSEVEQHFYEATKLFAAYSVAKQCTTALPMFAPKDISDSKTAAGRFSDSPYKETAKKICSQFDLNRIRLQNAYTALGSATAVTPLPILFAVSSPNTDRVVE